MKTTAKSLGVTIDVAAWQRIRHWIGLAGSDEVSGLGLVEEQYDGDELVGFVVTEVYLPEQVNDSMSTELDPASVAKLMLELDKKGGDPAALRYWWHLHPGQIGLTWSYTDDQCVDELQNGHWFVSSVFKPDMSVRTRVDVFKPVRVVIDNIPTEVGYPDLGLKDECRAMYKQRVKRQGPKLGRTTKSPGLTLPSLGMHIHDRGVVQSALMGCGREAIAADWESDLPLSAYSQEDLKEMLESGELTYPEYVAAVEELYDASDDPELVDDDLVVFDPKEKT